MLYLLISLLAANLSWAQNPVREGLEFPTHVAPQFGDEQVLGAIQKSVENSGVEPIRIISLDAGAEQVAVTVAGDGESAKFVCEVAGSVPVCEVKSLSETVLHQVDIPFGNLQAYGFQAQEIASSYASYAPWVAAAVVGLYAAKKVLNKITTGQFTASAGHEHSLFPDEHEMREELAENRKAMEEAIEGDLLKIAKPLIQAAACHGHHHDHDHDHEAPAGFRCEEVTPAQAEAARESLLRSFPKFAVAFGKDFYNELIAPVVGLAKAAKNKETRKQIWNFFDLISRRMIKERGVGAAIATGLFVGAGQAVIEILESFVMPAGAHLFCQVGNAAVLAMAASAYTAYFCMVQNPELKDKSLLERWRVSRQLARLAKRNSEARNPEETMIRALNLLFRLVERDVRHARNLGDLPGARSRELAVQLGTLKRDLNMLSIRLINKTATETEPLKWVRDLYNVQSKAQEAAPCADLLQSAS